MYGLVNRAIEQLVVSEQGEAGWQRVCARAGVEDDGFVAMCPYDDAVTYRLVGAVSEELGLTPSQVLQAFGEYWVLYTADEGYGELMNASGDDLRSFLGNLNGLHGRVEMAFPQMRLPLFSVEDLGPQEYRLVYESQRSGLAPMVQGLVQGLAKRFGQRVEVRHEQASTQPGQPDVFLVRHLAAVSVPDAGAPAARFSSRSRAPQCPHLQEAA